MGNWRAWLVAGGTVLGVLLTAGGLLYWGMGRLAGRETNQPSLKPTSQSSLDRTTDQSTSDQPTRSATTSVSADCPLSSGQASGADNQTGSRPEPYTHTTWLVRSNDGVSFTVEKEPLMEHASVPEIVGLPDGRLAVYVVDFRDAAGANQEHISILTSNDQGITWSEPQPICLLGKTSSGAAVDPSVVVLPDGRIRLYYFGFGPPPGSESGSPVPTGNIFYSAISDDGLRFSEEEDHRFEYANITDPEVIQRPDGIWLMYISRGQETLIASSSDGLSFTKTDSSLNQGGVPGAVVLSDGTIRWYGCGEGGIQTATAADGLNFDERQLVSLTPQPTDPIVCDPSIIRLADGTFIGVLKTAPAQAQPQAQPQSQPSGYR